MKKYQGALQQVGSWTGQPGSDGGRLEYIDVGGTHIKKLGCTSYMHDILTLNVGHECTLYCSAPFGTSVGSEVLGVRFADGRSRVAGKARVVKVALFCVIILPIVGIICCACPVGLIGGAVAGQSKAMGVMVTLLVVAMVLAAIVGAAYMAFRMVADYTRMAVEIGQDPNVKTPAPAPTPTPASSTPPPPPSA